MLVIVKMMNRFSIFFCQIKVFVSDVVWNATFRHYFVLPLYIVNMFHFYLNVDLLLIIKTIKFEVCLNFCRYVYVNINIDSKSIYIFIGNICINDDRECTMQQL